MVAPLLAVCGSLLIFTQRQHLELREFFPRHDLRATAKHLVPMLSPDMLTTEATTPGFFNILSWYLDQSPPNPLIIQHLEPGNTPITLHFIGGQVTEHEPMWDTAAYVRTRSYLIIS
jgi:hypothetical protein